jgi:hypothetical protein
MVGNYIIDSSLLSCFQKGKAPLCGLNGSWDIKFPPNLTLIQSLASQHPSTYNSAGALGRRMRILKKGPPPHQFIYIYK